jgi:ABC-type phosphate transport system substrate-binding protein
VSFTIPATLSRALRLWLAVLLLSVSSVASPLEGSSAVDVIVSPSHSSMSLDRSLLRAVFTMRLREWPDGSPVRVFVLPDNNPLSDQFYRERLGMYSYVLRRAWDRMVFTGTGMAPTVVQSETEMVERVRSTPGAIGYVRKRELSDADAELLQLSGNTAEERRQ